MLTRAVLALSVLAFATASALPAQVYLNGGLGYQASSSSGANVGGPYEYDSFNTGNSDLFFNFVTGTPVLLTTGSQTFGVSYGAPGAGDPIVSGIGLYFTTSNTLLTTSGLSPDLVAYRTPTGFATPSAGTSVPTLGGLSGDSPYSGATSFTLGGQIITITDWTNTSVTINVVPVPEPACLVFGTLGVLFLLRQRQTR